MLTPDLEARILELACARGLLMPSQIPAPGDLPSAPPAGGGPWPPRLAHLLETGALSAELLEALIWEARSVEDQWSPGPQSWVDPALTEASVPRLPENLDWDRYQSLTFLGMGGSARVYKAYDPRLERWVALKFLKDGQAAQEEAMLREARAQAQVEHPNVCKIYEVGQIESLHYIAMQLVQGPPLSQVMGDLSLRQKVELVRDVAEGVRAAHLQGLVHLDLKPGNILLEPRESGGFHPYVTDFGLMAAECLSDQGVLGTPPFSSPEQIRGDLAGLDRRSDVYSLGVVLYVLLSGALPFEADSPAELLRKIVETPPVPLVQRVPDLPEDLAAIVGVCMQKARERRYRSAIALAEDLQRFLDGEPVLARPSTRLYRLRKWVGRNRVLAGVTGVSALLVLGLGGFGIRTSLRARAQARLAQRFGQEAERIEALVRYAHLQPPHDIRPELAGIQARLASLRTEVDRAGAVAVGPGFHALGRGYMALGRLEEARGFLERAWKAGERGPSIELDLGRVLGNLYDEGLGELNSLQREERKKRREELERTLRDPALAHLRQGQADSPAEAAYQEALVAFYEDRHEEARRKTREALRQAPWFYEASILDAQIWLAEGRSKFWQRGRNEEAFADMARAAEPLAAAVARGASDPRNYLREADRWYGLAYLDSVYRPQEEEAALQKGIAAVDQALAVQPDSPQGHLLRAQFLWNLGRQRGLHGAEAEDAFRQARAAVDEGIRLDPANPRAHQIRGDVLGATAEWLSARGRDPLEAVHEGLASLNRALELGRRDHYTYRSMGYLLYTESNQILAKGQDPREAYRRAAEAYEQAIALDPKDTMSLNNVSVLCAQRLELDLEEGRFDTDLARRGLDFVARGLALAPDFEPFWSNKGYLLRLQARAARKQGGQAGPFLLQALEAGRRACELAPKAASGCIELGDTELESARWEAASGRSPRQALDRARQLFLRAQELNPQDSDGPRGLAEGYWIEAQWLASRHQDFRSQVKEGIACADRSHRLDPNQLQAVALRGALRLLTAQLGGPRSRAEAAAALMDLTQALKANPFLAPTFKPSLDAARRVLG